MLLNLHEYFLISFSMVAVVLVLMPVPLSAAGLALEAAYSVALSRWCLVYVLFLCRALIYTVSKYACTRDAPGVVLVRAAGAGLVHEEGVVLGQQGPHVVELGPLGHLVAARNRMGNLLHFLRRQTTLNTRV